jgi:class 3 adenylate cyclase
VSSDEESTCCTEDYVPKVINDQPRYSDAHLSQNSISTIDDIGLAFTKFSDKKAKLDSARFQKICKDCGLLDKKFKQADTDIVFTQVKRASAEASVGVFKLNLAGFQEALRLVAKKKGCAESDVFRAVAETSGPNRICTKTKAVRFHDDRKLYTGTHVHGGPDVDGQGKEKMTFRAATVLSSCARADPMPSFVDSLSQRLVLDPASSRANEQKIVQRTTSGGIEGSSVENTFWAYTRNFEQMDGKTFMKLCKDCHLIGESLSDADVDLTFARFKVRNLRHIDLPRFKSALESIALHKGETIDAVCNAVAASTGPLLTGTASGKVPFYQKKKPKQTVDNDAEQTWRMSLRPKERLPNFVVQHAGDLPDYIEELDARAIADFQRERRRLKESVKMRPPSDTDDVTMVFTDVQGSTALWEANPKAMEQALRIHDTTMRRFMAKHSGYEVTTEGDAFQIVFHDAFDAVGFCLDVQSELYSYDQWPTGILQHPDAEVSSGAWRGLRVRMGMNSGAVLSSSKHEVTGRMRYAGRTVAIAKAVEEVCHGGQILLAGSSFLQVNALLTQLQSPQVIDLGEHVLQTHGLGGSTNQSDAQVQIFQLVPTALAHDYFSCLACSHNSEKLCTDGRIFPSLASK